MRADILRLAADLARRGELFALATVVRREPPISAQLGDSALITEGGTFHGWLGGSCTRPTAVREALKALSSGTPRLIALSPDPGAVDRPGVTVLPMTCHSGGSVDIYIEPVLPAPRLIVFGVAPTAQAVARIGKVLGYVVEAVDPEADQAAFPEADCVVTDLHSRELVQRSKRDPARLYAVIATLGEQDEEAIRAALLLEPAYLGVVASRKRFARLRETLVAQGVAKDELDRIRNPAGLEIGAVSPEEIALSVLAEIVQWRRTQQGRTVGRPTSAVEDTETSAAEQLDPVCGMTVNPETSRHRADLAGQTYHFCSGSCRERFLAEPERFAAPAGAG